MRNKKAFVAKCIIAGATAMMLVAIGGLTAILWPDTTEGESAELPHELNESSPAAEVDSGSLLGWQWEADISEAMQNDDREAFLAHSSGAATEKMAHWWDSTKAIGWDLGYATASRGDDGSWQLSLGVQLAFSSHPIRGSGSPDAGLLLMQNFTHGLSVEGEGDDIVITDWEPHFSMPWDYGEIYVAKRDHVVLYGLATERALVDANIDLAEESAKLTFDTLEKLGGSAPVDGFVVAITDDQQGFDTWLGKGDLDWTMDVAGYARATARPPFLGSSAIPPGVATGSETSGSLVVLGPDSSEQRQRTFVHEFAHVLHEVAAPDNYLNPTEPAPTEGFARYFEVAAGVGDGYFEHPQVAQSIIDMGEGAMTEKALRSHDAWVAYAVAGSFYQYVADSGGSPWQLALDRRNGLTMALRAKEQSPGLSEEGWQSWAAAQ